MSAYLGHRLNLLPKAQRVTTARSGKLHTNGESGAILIIDVSARVGGSISALKVYLKSPDGRTETNDIAIYSITGLAINAKGVYAFLVSPAGGDAAGWTAAPVAGVMPPEFEFEAVLAGGTDMTFSAWMMPVSC